MNILEEAFKDIQKESNTSVNDAIPDRCFNCATNPICNIIGAFITMYSFGIKLQVERCPFSRKTKTNESASK